jgi:hypothetical protein
MAQQALRRHDDERAALPAAAPVAQQVEVLRGRRAVGDADVVLGGELEEPLEAGAGMLGALSLVAVRQQQHQRGLLLPLGAARGEELVDDDLSAVHEVAELCLPEHERRRRDDAVAVLEADGGELGERAVVHLERRLRLVEVGSGV